MAYLRSCGTSNCLTDNVVFFSSGLVGIGWTQPQNLKHLFLKTYPLTCVQCGWLFSVHTVTPFITAAWGGCRGGEGRVRAWSLRQALPPSAWPYNSHSSSLQYEELPGGSQLGAVLLFFPCRNFLKFGAPTVQTFVLGVGGENSGSDGRMKQVAKTLAATPRAKRPLPTAATAKTILFFCFPHLKKGLQPNGRPWPHFIFPMRLLLTPFSYGTYEACHQMRRRWISQSWWREQRWAVRDVMNSFCHKYTSRIDLNSIWVNELQAEMIKMHWSCTSHFS